MLHSTEQKFAALVIFDKHLFKCLKCKIHDEKHNFPWNLGEKTTTKFNSFIRQSQHYNLNAADKIIEIDEKFETIFTIQFSQNACDLHKVN